MSKIVEAIVDAVTWVVETTWEAVVDVVSFVWNEIALPMLEEIFSWFGIEDETLVTVSKVSSKVFAGTDEDVVKAAKTRAVLHWMKTDISLWKHINYEMDLTRGKVGSYYRFAEKGHYIHGLPSMTISGETKDEGQIKIALDSEKSINSVVTYTSSVYPTGEEYFKNDLQTATTNYKPGLDTLTYDDEWGNSWDDWSWTSVAYISGSNEYEIQIQRTAQRATFWMEAPLKITEGGSVDVVINSNRTVPAGENVTINLSYGGTLGIDHYTAPASVVMPGGSSTAIASITITEDAITEAVESLIPEIIGITNTNGAFEYVQIGNQNSVDIGVYDNESLVLTLNSVLVNENDMFVLVPVTLTQDATLEVTQTDTFIEGTDYNNPGPSNTVTLSVVPEDPSYVYVEFDGVENIDYTLSGQDVVFTTDIPPGTAQIVVQTSSRGFTVDYGLSEGTAIGGIDYDDTGGTLTFNGNSGETRTVEIPLTADVMEGAREDFFVTLLNCSDPNVDTSRTATVTLVDSLPGGPVPDTVTYYRTLVRPQFDDSRAMVVRYYLEGGDENDWYYWIYWYSSGTYPEVNPTIATITELEMLPVAIVRKDKINVSTDKQSDEYLTARNLLKKTDLDIDEIIEGLEGNEAIDNIDDVYVNYAMSPSDNSSEISKLLFLTFYEIIFVRGISSNSNKFTAMFKEQDVNNATIWTGQSYTTDLIGVVAEEGKYLHTIHHTEEFNSLTMQFQRTADRYDEIILENVQGMASIAYDGYHKAAFTSLKDSSFTIPVSWWVYQQLTNEEIMRVYQDIFRVDLYSIDITHLEWYETEAFFKFIKFALIVVAIVTTIMTFGAASTFWGGVWAVFQSWAINYLVMEIVVAIAEETGNAYLAAAVALVAAFIMRDIAGLSQTGFFTAEGITTLVTTFSAGLGTVYQNEIEGMESEREELLEEQEEREEYYEDNAVENGGLDASFYAALMSVDSMIYSARDAQYDFDAQLTGAYDRLITNYHDLLLDLGVV